MPLSNLPGPWRWEERQGRWWRIHDELNIEDGPHMPDETRTPVTICWHCDRPLDAASGFGPSEGMVPKPGSVSLCLYCGAVAIFETDLRLRSPWRMELDELEKDNEFMRQYMQFAWARQYVMIKSNLMHPDEGPDR